MNTLEHFLNIDDLAVLRMKSMGSEAPAQSIVRALRQVGKEYDFNFDRVMVKKRLPYRFASHMENFEKSARVNTNLLITCNMPTRFARSASSSVRIST